MNKKLLAVLLAVAMVFTLASCGPKEEPTTAAAGESTTAGEQGTDAQASSEGNEPEVDSDSALVIAKSAFSGKFNPYFYATQYDNDVNGMVFSTLTSFDEKNNPNNEGLSEYYEPEVVRDADGNVEKVIYKFILKDGLTFSDGTPITTEDVEFSALLQLDPKFTSPLVTFDRTPIIGALEYKYDDPNYAEKLEAIAAEVEAYVPTEEEIAAFAEEYSEKWGVEPESLMEGGTWFESDTIPTLKENKQKELEYAYIEENLSDGTIDVPSVEGIEVIDEKEIHFVLSKLYPIGDYQLSLAVLPKHYYAPDFQKGDAPEVEKLNGAPMGSGPYKFVSYEDGIVSFVANENYYNGAPKIQNIKFQEVEMANMLQVLANGDVDISEPTASPTSYQEAKDYENVTPELIDNNGYGYIAINANNVPDKNIRKGLFHLLDRRPAISSYYGDLASVIERPMSKVSWAYPEEATEYYGFDPAKALEYFQAAGYEQVDGKLMKDGEQLTINVGIPGDGVGDHPSYPIVNTLKVEGEALGLVVEVRDLKGGAFWTALDGEEFDMWCAAWGGAADPDMYQVYHSEGASNKQKYHLNNPELDQLIMDALDTLDRAERKAIYAKALDIVMDEAVEMPIYQRKNMNAFNHETLDLDSLPEELTPFMGYLAYPEKLELLAE